MKTNYHTHNYRCIHATGTVEEYVEEAIKAGIDEIGISDHLPHPGSDLDSKNRMKYEELELYFKEIDAVKEKYNDKISIKKSIECEYFREYKWLYEELREKHKTDYLLLGVHFFIYKGEYQYIGWMEQNVEVLESYTDYVIESMESGYFHCLAHPDLFGIVYKDWDEHTEKASRRIFEKAEELKIPLEININGMRRGIIKYNKGERYMYPHKDFWQLSKEYNLDIIVGIDAHKPKDMQDLDMGYRFVEEMGLKTIDRLELK